MWRIEGVKTLTVDNVKWAAVDWIKVGGRGGGCRELHAQEPKGWWNLTTGGAPWSFDNTSQADCGSLVSSHMMLKED